MIFTCLLCLRGIENEFATVLLLSVCFVF